jgi:thiol:disulfide interchange protein DsbD
MTWLLFAIGLNMSGVFMVGGTLAGAGQGLAARGSFFTGLLAVVVATPCTAPFMGAALAAALALPPADGMLIFVALGLGLSAPYAALALSPGAAALLPRPGAWMDVLKHLLAFPMYGAALWMLWVVSQQTDAAGLAAVLASLLCVGFAAWAYGYGQQHGRPMLLNGAALLSLLGGVAVLAGFGFPTQAAAAHSGIAADGSEPYSAARLASLRAEHRPVLVDMSAAWCVTCLVNERVALTPQPVRAAFASHKVAYLKGDWTNRDAGITDFLRQYDRSGVPLYVFYPADGPPEVLPQILTPGMILARIGAG